jgi:quercetin dioxygenase-like cupin family protein
MPVIDYGALPEFPMRAGISGKWLSAREHGATALSVLSNTAAPGVAVPRHFHEYEEVILVEAGEVWVELDEVRLTAGPSQSVIIPPHTTHAWGTEGPEAARVLFIWPVLEPFAAGKSTYLEGARPAVE